MSDYTPSLTAPPSIEFWATDDDNWQVGKWPELSDLFSLTASELEDWFQTVSGQGRAWTAVRRVYQVHPTIIENIEDAENQQPKTMGEVAKELGISKQVLEKEVAGLCQFWNKKRSALQLKHKMERSDRKSETAHLDPYTASDLDPEKVTSLLQRLHLDNIKEDALRIHVASRILDLQPQLNDKSTQVITRQVIRLEISAWEQERHIDYLGNRKREIEDSGKPAKEIHQQLSKLQEEITRADKHLATIHEKITKGITTIGADQMDEFQAARHYTGAWSEGMDRIKQWYADPENILMDGVFTRKEIEWQMTQTDFRGPQYRPDFVATINEAMKPENLYNPEFKSRSPNRETCRYLQKIVRQVAEEEAARAKAAVTGLASAEEDEPDEAETTENTPLIDEAPEPPDASTGHPAATIPKVEPSQHATGPRPAHKDETFLA